MQADSLNDRLTQAPTSAMLQDPQVIDMASRIKALETELFETQEKLGVSRA